MQHSWNWFPFHQRPLTQQLYLIWPLQSYFFNRWTTIPDTLCWRKIMVRGRVRALNPIEREIFYRRILSDRPIVNGQLYIFFFDCKRDIFPACARSFFPGVPFYFYPPEKMDGLKRLPTFRVFVKPLCIKYHSVLSSSWAASLLLL